MKKTGDRSFVVFVPIVAFNTYYVAGVRNKTEAIKAVGTPRAKFMGLDETLQRPKGIRIQTEEQ